MTKNYEEQINKIVAGLTLKEKSTIIHGGAFFRTDGIEEKGIPCLVTSDGPMGVRKNFFDHVWMEMNISDDFVTYLPSNSAIAATWNKEIAYKGGQVLGEEARGRSKDVILAPGINIKRDPLCGRNFEYMSEDPCLVEELVVPLIQGVQESDVAACVKHFAVNNQETNRLWVDTEVDERTLREIYLPGFKAAVQKAGSYSLMNAYNLFEGVHCSANKRLLKDILRDEWGYDGAIISDWGSVHDTKVTAAGAMDLEMSVDPKFDDYYFAKPLIEAVEKGEVSMEDVDEKVRNILRLMYRVKMIGPESVNRKAGAYNTKEHQEATLQAAREAIVLLKNEENVLPITEDRVKMEPGELAPKKKRIAVIGRNAEYLHANGGGSAEIKALYEISPLMGIKTYLGGNVDVVYGAGYYVPDGKQEKYVENWQGSSLEIKSAKTATEEEMRKHAPILAKRQELLEEAIALAKTADEVVFVGGLNHHYDVEGWDRNDMKLPYAQDELIEALLEVNPNTIVVMVAGSPVEMPWKDKAKAILWNYFSGMEAGFALAEILFGKVNPSAKLPESMPMKYEDTVTFKNGEFKKEDKVVYKEGLFFGYRYYEKEGIQPAFAFGHGLSYTDFAFGKVQVEVLKDAHTGVFGTGAEADLEKAAVKVSIDVTNTGEMAGAEVLQCYVSDPECSVERPVKELRSFGKVFLQPGETKTVEMFINNRGFAFYDVASKAFLVEPGEFVIHVGTSSDRIVESATIQL